MAGALPPTLLTLATMFSRRYADYPSEFPRVHRGVDAGVFDELQKPFDFVVVGSGFAGSFLAGRLSDLPCARVLVLEAGGVPTFDSAIPFAQIHDRNKTEYGYKSVSQKKAAQAMQNQEVNLPVGKSLGGDAVVDSGVYMNANLGDFHRWSYLYSLEGWGWVEMKPFIFELQNEKEAAVHDRRLRSMKEHSILASIHNVEQGMNLMDQVKAAWLKSSHYLNASVADVDRQSMFYDGGFFLPRTMVNKGMKINPAAQFMSGGKNNLVVITHAEVEGLLYTPDGRRVVGLTFKDTLTGTSHHVNVLRDVILSTGTIGSAQILMQSGIGPRDTLSSQNIPVLLDLPVGARLSDRVAAPLFVRTNKRFSAGLRSQLDDPDEFMNFLVNGKGVLANASVVGCALLRTANSNAPNILIEAKPIGLVEDDLFFSGQNYKPEVIDLIDPTGELLQYGGLAITVTHLRPFSQGTMWVWRRHDDTFVPRMNPSYLSDQRDIDSLVQGIRQVEELVRTDFFAAMGAELVYPALEGCPAPLLPSTDAYWSCYLSYFATSGNHLTSTVPLGTVVDDHLRVKGVGGLRVVDQSVFPETVSGGVAGSILALANRALTSITSDHRLRC